MTWPRSAALLPLFSPALHRRPCEMASKVVQVRQAARQLLDGMCHDAGHAACSTAQAEKLVALLQGATLSGQEGVEVVREVSSTNWAKPADLECVLSSLLESNVQVVSAKSGLHPVA